VLPFWLMVILMSVAEESFVFIIAASTAVSNPVLCSFLFILSFIKAAVGFHFVTSEFDR